MLQSAQRVVIVNHVITTPTPLELNVWRADVTDTLPTSPPDNAQVGT